MKVNTLIVASFLLTNLAFGQEKTSNTERSLQAEPVSTKQSDTVRTEIKTERTLQTKKETKKQEKEVKVKNERAIRNEE